MMGERGGNRAGKERRQMAKKKAWTAKELREAAAEYFRSITRPRLLTEQEGKGEEQPVRNALSQTVEVTDFLLPPTENDLCLRLGLPWEQWQRYSQPDSPLYPVTQQVRERIMAWCLRELLTRPGKDLKGIELFLERLGPAAPALEREEVMSLEDKLAAIRRIFQEGGG